MARKSESPRRKFATCVRSLFWKRSTSLLLIAGGDCFFPTAVIVIVTGPVAAGTGEAATSPTTTAITDAPSKSSARLDWFLTFMVLTPFLSSLLIRCGHLIKRVHCVAPSEASTGTEK